MKKTTLISKVGGKPDVKVTVYENGTPGLFVGRRLWRGEQTGRWDIYHHSGYLVPSPGYNTRKQATGIMQELGNLTDWTKDPETIARNGYDACGHNHLGHVVMRICYA